MATHSPFREVVEISPSEGEGAEVVPGLEASARTASDSFGGDLAVRQEQSMLTTL